MFEIFLDSAIPQLLGGRRHHHRRDLSNTLAVWIEAHWLRVIFLK